MCLTLNSFLTADMAGGFWKMAPCKNLTFFFNSLNGFSASILLFSLMMLNYSLPAFCWLLANLVADSMQIISTPVTLGSRVPEWPVLLTLRMRLTQDTTSCEDGFDGLSRLMKPYLRWSFMLRFRGSHPYAIGVQCPSFMTNLSKFFINNGHSDVSILGVSCDFKWSLASV